jgi:hypothetical protein
MSDLLWIGISVVTFGAGWLIGRRGHGPNRCGCTHSRALHSPDTGVCRGVVARMSCNEFNEFETVAHEPCPCQQFVPTG